MSVDTPYSSLHLSKLTAPTPHTDTDTHVASRRLPRQPLKRQRLLWPRRSPQTYKHGSSSAESLSRQCPPSFSCPSGHACATHTHTLPRSHSVSNKRSSVHPQQAPAPSSAIQGPRDSLQPSPKTSPHSCTHTHTHTHTQPQLHHSPAPIHPSEQRCPVPPAPPPRPAALTPTVAHSSTASLVLPTPRPPHPLWIASAMRARTHTHWPTLWCCLSLSAARSSPTSQCRLCLGRHLHPASLPQAFHSWTVRLYIWFKAAPPKTLCSGHPGLGFGGLRPLWGLLAPGHPGLSAKNSEYPVLP